MKSSSALCAIADRLAELPDWEDRYRFLIALGQAMPPLKPAERTASTRVSGCVSQVWLVVTHDDSHDTPLIRLRGESDAAIIQGLIAVLLVLYSDRPAIEAAEIDVIAALEALGLRQNLSMQRSNGLLGLANRIRAEARAMIMVDHEVRSAGALP